MSRDAEFDPYHVWLQIPQELRPPTHYQLLGVAPKESNDEVIRQAKLMRASFLRNYQTGEHAAEVARLLEELENAALVLTDAKRRAAYEATLKPVARATPTVVRLPAEPPVRTVAAPPTPPVELAPPRSKKKPSKTKTRRTKSRLADWAYLVLAIALVGGVGFALRNSMFATNAPLVSSAFDQPEHAIDLDANKSSSNAAADPKTESERTANATAEAKPTAESDAPAADLVKIDIDVEPAAAEIAVEPIWGGGKSAGGHRLLGSGARRTLEISKASLPVVLTAKLDEYFTEERVLGGSTATVTIRLRAKGASANGSAPPPDNGRRVVVPYRVGIPFSDPRGKALWRYTPNDPGLQWADFDFNDAKWSEGYAAFGNRTKSGKRVIRVPGLNLQTVWTSTHIWLRRRLTLPKEIVHAKVRWFHWQDDRIKVKVNGRLQFESSDHGWTKLVRELDGRDFVEGENVIAVHCVNVGGPGFVEVGFDWAPTEPAK